MKLPDHQRGVEALPVSFPHNVLKKVLNYLLSHWRGNQPLVRSFLINGLGLFAIGFCLGLLFAVMHSQGILFALMVLCWYVFFLFWWLVGITRASSKTLCSTNAKTPNKLFALAILSLVSICVYFTINDLWHLVGRPFWEAFHGYEG